MTPFAPQFGKYHYVLKGHIPVPCEDPFVFALWFDDPYHRRVAETIIGRCQISTVFTGRSISPYPVGLFETMCMGGDFDMIGLRYSTWEEAEAGHQGFVKLVGEHYKHKTARGLELLKERILRQSARDAVRRSFGEPLK